MSVVRKVQRATSKLATSLFYQRQKGKKIALHKGQRTQLARDIRNQRRWNKNDSKPHTGIKGIQR